MKHNIIDNICIWQPRWISLVLFEKRPHFSFFTCQAKPNSFNTPNEFGWLLMVQGPCWNHTLESASEQCRESWTRSPRGFKCLMDVLHPQIAALLHKTTETSPSSHGLCVCPWSQWRNTLLPLYLSARGNHRPWWLALSTSQRWRLSSPLGCNPMDSTEFYTLDPAAMGMCTYATWPLFPYRSRDRTV